MAASSAADPASWTAAATYESANGSAFFVKEYFPVPSSGGNQCKNRHAPIWHFG